MPGYGFSGKPAATGWGPEHIARACRGGRKRIAPARSPLSASSRARRRARADVGDHLPRRGVRVHVRVAEMDDWVVVEVAGSEPEAELLCSVLRGAGIECLPRLTNSGAGLETGWAPWGRTTSWSARRTRKTHARSCANPDEPQRMTARPTKRRPNWPGRRRQPARRRPRAASGRSPLRTPPSRRHCSAAYGSGEPPWFGLSADSPLGEPVALVGSLLLPRDHPGFPSAVTPRFAIAAPAPAV
jgi:hypothetical protein